MGDALNHSLKIRTQADGTIVVRIFAESLVIENPTAKTQEAVVMKEEGDLGFVEAVTCNQNAINFRRDEGYLRFRLRLFPKETARVSVTYFENRNVSVDWENVGFGCKIKTHLRRYLSEFRDNYVSQSDFLYKNATRIKQCLRG